MFLKKFCCCLDLVESAAVYGIISILLGFYECFNLAENIKNYKEFFIYLQNIYHFDFDVESLLTTACHFLIVAEIFASYLLVFGAIKVCLYLNNKITHSFLIDAIKKNNTIFSNHTINWTDKNRSKENAGSNFISSDFDFNFNFRSSETVDSCCRGLFSRRLRCFSNGWEFPLC